MVDDQVEMPPELLQRLAREEAEAIRLARSTLLEQHSHLFKWLTGSLLAVNGGAAVALLNTDNVEPLSKMLPGSIFGAGLFFALLIGVLNQRAMQSTIDQLQKRLGYWIEVDFFAERDAEVELEHEKVIKRSLVFSHMARFAGWISALMFFGGYVLAGLQMERPVDERVDHHTKHLNDHGYGRSSSADDRQP